MTRRVPTVAPGSRVRLHQAFRCCPYAGTVYSQIADFFEQNGMTLVHGDGEADLHVVHSCGSDAAQSQLSFDALHALEGTKAGVLLTGCLSRIDPKGVEAALAPFGAAARFGPPELERLSETLGAPQVAWDDVLPTPTRPYGGNDFSETYRHVLASVGCLGTCGFCAIRRATGRPKSRPIEAILADVDAGIAAGQRDQLIVSTDLSAWGTDLSSDVVALIEALNAHRPGEVLYAAESFEPTLLLAHGDRLLPLLASGRWAVLGVPIQSGSRRMIGRMARDYDPDAVIAWVRQLKALAPETLTRTDILFGYADETDEEFEASIVASRAFDLPSYNVYQPRPGTEPLQLGPEILAARRARATEELYARAVAGLAEIPLWGGHRQRSRYGAGSADPTTQLVRPADGSPWASDEGRAWIEAKASRLSRALRPAMPLGHGWRLVAAEAAADAVVLVAQAGNHVVEIGLRPASWPGQHGWTGRSVRLWIRSADVPPDFDPVLKALLAALDRAQPPAAAPR
ncbi:MAG: hypothetical protein RLZZ383_600 [Pseudomonadota bacterium]